MANVRIKDITTTASAPAADDYLAIDGATAGTRKISAANLGGDTLTTDVKDALLQIASKVAYIDDQGQTYYDDLYDALYPPAPPATLLSISAVYTQSGTVYDTDTLDSLKPDLVVTASYDDGTTQTVTTYTLSGTLTAGTSTITVSYGGKTTTFNVTVTEGVPYTFYDYIAMTLSAGTAIASNEGILTDIGISTSDTFETKVKYSSTYSNMCNICGIRNGQSGTKEFGLFYNTSSGKLGYWYGNTDTTQTHNVLVRNQVNTIKVLPVGISQTYPTKAVLNVNGTDYDTGSTATGQTFNSWLGFFKYGISATSTSTSTTDKYGGIQIGETIIRDNSNNIIHHLKPASDGSHYGFYDEITDNFYYHSTSTNYTAGNWA